MSRERDSSQRTQSGHDQAGSGTILSNDDPLKLGRCLWYSDQWDPSHVPLTSGIWIHTSSSENQTAAIGKSRHVDKYPGERCSVNYDHRGTGHIQDAHTSYGGPDAPAGGTMTPTMPGYPSNHPPKGSV